MLCRAFHDEPADRRSAGEKDIIETFFEQVGVGFAPAFNDRNIFFRIYRTDDFSYDFGRFGRIV